MPDVYNVFDVNLEDYSEFNLQHDLPEMWTVKMKVDLWLCTQGIMYISEFGRLRILGFVGYYQRTNSPIREYIQIVNSKDFTEWKNSNRRQSAKRSYQSADYRYTNR